MKPISFAVALLGTGLLIGCQPRDQVQEATAKLKPVVDSYVQAWNTGNLDSLDGIIDPQFARYVRTTIVEKGLDSLKNAITVTRTEFPDFKVTVEEELYVEDHATVRWTITGTDTGPGSIPPTGKSFKVGGMSLFRFANGKIAEERTEYDNLQLLQQIGFRLMPPGK
jgi:steroid delta-isomerase-like uncharacterized protein